MPGSIPGLISGSPRPNSSSLRVRSDSLPWARQGHAVAPSGSSPVHNQRQPQVLEAIAAVAAELEAG